MQQNGSDFNRTCISNSKISFKDTNRECCSGDRDKLKDVQTQRPLSAVKKSKSVYKLSGMGGGSKKLTKKDKSLPYISYRNNSKSPNRSSRNAKKIIDGLHSSRSQGNISTKNEERSKEPAPIIINKDEHFQYKPPSLIHETVVNTLRKEKDNLTQALRNQREAN